MVIELKYLDFYVDNSGSLLRYDFNDETILQYSNNFVVRLLSEDLVASQVLLDVLQPDGNLISGIEMVQQTDIVIDGITYKQWKYQLTQFDTSVVGNNADYGKLKFSFYIENAATSIIKTTDTIAIGIELNLAVDEADLIDMTETPTIFDHIQDLEDDIDTLRAQVIGLGGTPEV